MMTPEIPALPVLLGPATAVGVRCCAASGSAPAVRTSDNSEKDILRRSFIRLSMQEKSCRLRSSFFQRRFVSRFHVRSQLTVRSYQPSAGIPAQNRVVVPGRADGLGFLIP